MSQDNDDNDEQLMPEDLARRFPDQHDGPVLVSDSHEAEEIRDLEDVPDDIIVVSPADLVLS